MTNSILKMDDVVKQYNGIKVLKGVTFSVIKGEIHGLIGENGAGKSTLIKSIAGAILIDGGKIYFDGKELDHSSPKSAIKSGIGVVYQEFNLFPNLTVYENIFYGNELLKNGILDRKQMIDESKKIIDQLGFNFDVNLKVKQLSTAFQQITEIAKCIKNQVKLLIMDEPSAPLTENEVDKMFEMVYKLNQKGVTIIYISHKLDEILKITNRISVLRDGEYIATLQTNQTNEAELIRLMVGRDLHDIYPEKLIGTGETILECKNLSGGIVKNVNFKLHRGEVLGFGGLVGSGRTETIRLLFGADKKESGEIKINGIIQNISSPIDAIKYGIGLIPEDRKIQGLILNKSIYFNALLPSLNTFCKFGIISENKAKKMIKEYSNKLSIKANGIEHITVNLSGGNQQKVVIEKWLMKNCEILILDEPTRGIDVGAKHEIYRLIQDLAKSGKAIIVISSEMPELIGISHRIMVMKDGTIQGELVGNNMNQEAIMRLAS